MQVSYTGAHCTAKSKPWNAVIYLQALMFPVDHIVVKHAIRLSAVLEYFYSTTKHSTAPHLHGPLYIGPCPGHTDFPTQRKDAPSAALILLWQSSPQGLPVPRGPNTQQTYTYMRVVLPFVLLLSTPEQYHVGANPFKFLSQTFPKFTKDCQCCRDDAIPQFNDNHGVGGRTWHASVRTAQVRCDGGQLSLSSLAL
jgi:hypothetical protein